MNNPKISIIVPVYNVEKHLEKCLESIINQTYYNIEIILVDDGSKDESGRICDAYSEKDLRIKVIHKENGGVSSARNVGMKNSKGDYLMFVDSDDWVDVTICEELLNAIVKYNAKSAMCSYMREYPENPLPKRIFNNDLLLNGNLVERKLCGPIEEELRFPENVESLGSMCGKLYPACIKENEVIDINVVGTSEDILFNLQVFHNIDNMIFINKPYYHYRKAVDTSVTAKYKPDLEEKWQNLYKIMEETINKNSFDEVFYQAFNNRIALGTLGLGLNCIADNAGIAEKCKRLKKVIYNEKRKAALKQLDVKYMPIHWKLFYFCAKYKFVLMLYIMLKAINYLKGKI